MMMRTERERDVLIEGDPIELYDILEATESAYLEDMIEANTELAGANARILELEREIEGIYEDMAGEDI